jgi:hypothetical protein
VAGVVRVAMVSSVAERDQKHSLLGAVNDVGRPQCSALPYFLPPSMSSNQPSHYRSQARSWKPGPTPCTDASCRSLWNIVWSCIVTIFACTCVAVHPNVPTPDQKAHWRWYSTPLRRARIMLCALICPELFVIWACHQRIGASRTSETLKGVALDGQETICRF